MSGVVRWLHNPSSNRSKRSEVVNDGCFMLEHEATGRFILGESANVSAEVDKCLAALEKGTYKNKLFNRIVEKDNVIRVHEFPEKSAKKRKILMKGIISECSTPYLFLR